MNRPARRRSSKQQSLAAATPDFGSLATSTNTNNKTNAMDAAGAHRKIELQSPEDLTYLITNVRRAAAAHIGEAFPPVEGEGDDELRVRIEKMVDEVRFLLLSVYTACSLPLAPTTTRNPTYLQAAS